MGDADVPLDAVGARELAVHRVTDDGVDEGVLRRAQDGRPSIAAQELLAAQGAKQLVDRLAVVLGDGPQPVRPDNAAHHGGVSEQLLLGGRTGPPRGDDPQYGLRKPADSPPAVCMRTNSSA